MIKEAMVLAVWFVIMSIVLFVMMGMDKKKAKAGAWRIPEARLFLFSFLGGAIGGCIGMKVFHHKTKHLKFEIGFPLIALMQIAALGYLIIR